MLRYYKLYDVLQRKGMKVKDLKELTGLTDPTLAKLRKGENINTKVIDEICKALNVQPGDIMEYE